MARQPEAELDAREEPRTAGEMAPGMPLDDFPPYLLNRIVNRLNSNLTEELKTVGVTLQHYRILAVLVARDDRNVGELAVYTVTEQSTLSKMLDRMEEAGLVARKTDPQDRRVVQITITEAGREAYERILPIAMKHYRRALHGLTESEQEHLVDMLHRVLENVRRSPFP